MTRPRPIGRVLILAGMLGASVACYQQNQPAPLPDNRAADEQAIRALAADWFKAGAAKDADKFASFYAPDASAFPPHSPKVTGKDNLRDFWAEFMKQPGFALSGGPVKVEAARSGDLTKPRTLRSIGRFARFRPAAVRDSPRFHRFCP